MIIMTCALEEALCAYATLASYLRLPTCDLSSHDGESADLLRNMKLAINAWSREHSMLASPVVLAELNMIVMLL